MGAMADPRTVTVTIGDTATLHHPDGHPVTAAAVLDLEPGEYRWTSDPALVTMDVELSAWGGKVVFESAGFGHRALPLTFGAVLSSGPAHDGAVPVGRIERLATEGQRVVGEGWVTVGEGDDDPGRQYALALANRNMRAVSVDAAALEYTDRYILDDEGMPVDMITDMHRWEIMGLTAVNAGADPDAAVSLDTIQGAPEQMPDEEADDTTVDEEEDDDGEEPMAAAVTVASAEWRPPADWFDNPNLDRVTPLQVGDDGRVYGHIAPWSQPGDTRCHVGFADRCVCAPRSPDGDYPYFLTGEVACADGTRRRCGVIALYGGHHADDGKVPWTQVAALYEDPRNLGALVNVGEDDHGLWAAGCVRPGMTPEQVAELRACGPSGHWRRIQGDRHAAAQRLIAACAVMSQGYPIQSLAASADQRPAAAEGPKATWDDAGLVVLTAATGTATLAHAKDPVSRDAHDRLAADLVALRGELAVVRGQLALLDGPIRAGATEALTTG